MSLAEELSSPLLQWEKRDDGMYLTASSDAGATMDKRLLRELLDSKNIMNYDWNRILTVVDQSKNRPEFIGPHFSIYNREKDNYINVITTPEEARIKIDSNHLTKFLSFTLKDIEYKFKELRITHGVNWPVISDILKKSQWDIEHVIAVSTPPQHGIDGKLIEKVPIDPDAKPITLQDGRVDFKNIKNIRQIREGDLIAIRNPPVMGKPGIDVFGNPITPKEGVDVELPAGVNTKIHPDGKQLMAGNSGYLYRDKGKICIGELLCIEGDINFKTGNIKYSGDVIINGNVQGGFSIDVKGHIHIMGTVDSAQIVSRTGTITIEKGVFGKSKANIQAKQNIRVQRIQDATLESEGEVTILQSCRNTKVFGQRISFERGCEIIGCNLVAYDSINAHVLGIGDTENKLIILDRMREDQAQKMDEYQKLLSKVLEATIPIEKRIKGMNKMLHNSEVEATEKIKEEVKQVVVQYHDMQKKSRYIQEKIEELKIEMARPRETPGVIRIFDVCMPGEVIEMYGKALTLRQAYSKIEFFFSPDGIATRPIAIGANTMTGGKT